MQTLSGNWMFIDTSGKVILPPIANEPEYTYTDHGNFIFSIDKKKGSSIPKENFWFTTESANAKR